MANNLKVLLPDDGPPVLGMLQQSLSTLSEVTTVNYGLDDLLKPVADDLVGGHEAVFRALDWTGVNFPLDFEGKTWLQTCTLNTRDPLIEGLRLLDEANRDATESEDVLLDT